MLLLLALLPTVHAQSTPFITLQPPTPQPTSDSNRNVIVTPRFVPAPQRGKPVVVPAGPQEPGNVIPNSPIVPVAAQMPAVPVRDEERELIRTELPGPQRLFVRESEAQFFDRVNKELVKQHGPGRVIPLPEDPVVSRQPYRPRQFKHLVHQVEPSYVCHRRLLFEQPNFERTGWDLGILTPAANLGVFYYDMLMLPYHFCSDWHDRGECNAGKCLPGDQTPLLLYRERASGTGALGQAGVVLGTVFLFFP